MSQTIFCTNPNCNSVIQIPEGMLTVVCQTCNTWQMVEDGESADGAVPPAADNSGMDAPGAMPPSMNPNPSPPPGASTEPAPFAVDPNPPNPNFPLPEPAQPPSIDAPIDTPAGSVLPPNLSYTEFGDTGTPGNPVNPSQDENQTQRVPELGYLNTESGERLKLKLGKNTVGRQGTDLIVNDKTISRKHCVIEIVKNELGEFDYFVFDIGHESGQSSTNGVYISGRSQRLEDFERIKLFNGSSITIGNVRLVLTT